MAGVKTKQRWKNRATLESRPTKAADCRTPHYPEAHVCLGTSSDMSARKGHNHVFLRGDRYGCCTQCGDEILV